MSEDLVTETLDYDGGRQVGVFVPPEPAASPGAGYQPPATRPDPLPRTYLVAGTQEPFFLDNATRWADALRAADADVVLFERDGAHGGAFWAEEFPLMLAWAFGR